MLHRNTSMKHMIIEHIMLQTRIHYDGMLQIEYTVMFLIHSKAQSYDTGSSYDIITSAIARCEPVTSSTQ